MGNMIAMSTPRTPGWSTDMAALDRRLAGFATLRRFERGALMVRAGEAAETVYWLRAGQARTFLLREDGCELTTAVVGPGHPIGIAALVGRPAYHLFAEALTPVEAWACPAARLLDQLAHDAAALELLGRHLAERLALADQVLQDIALRSVAERIPRILPRLRDCLDGEAPRLSRQLLASLVGARRETVSRLTSPTRAGAERRSDARST